MIKTRWNPTTNGALHVGHLYSLLANERFAHEQDGEFYVRLDDTSSTATNTLDRLPRIVEEQHQNIEWLKIEVDRWQWQSNLSSTVERKLKELDFEHHSEPKYVKPLLIRLGFSFIPYPFTPQQTAERVVMDNMLGITHVIRGEDFVTEYSLYCYYCQQFDFPTPKFVFLPRLMGKEGDISKTNGGYTLAELRNNGYSPQDLKEMITNACLIYPENEWSFYNLKPNPLFII